MSSWNFMPSWVEHEKSCITSGPLQRQCYVTLKGFSRTYKGPSLIFKIFQEFKGLPFSSTYWRQCEPLNSPLFPVPDKSGSGKLLFSRIIQENLSIFKYFIKPVQTLNTAILPLVPGVCLVKVVSKGRKNPPFRHFFKNTEYCYICSDAWHYKALKYYLQNAITIIYKYIQSNFTLNALHIYLSTEQ